MRKDRLKIFLLVSLILNLALVSIIASGFDLEDMRGWVGRLLFGTQEKVFENKPVVLFFDSEREEISPAHKDGNEATQIPKTELFMQSGFYSFGDEVYDCTRGGLYRFIVPTQEIYNRIVDTGGIIGMLGSIAWLHIHGNSDDQLSFEEKKSKLLDDRLYLTCGAMSVFTRDFLAEFGVKSRVVTSLTLDEWNSYDNGHTMLEVLGSDGWFVADIDSGKLFMKEGKYLNFIELIEASPSDDYQIISLNQAPNLDLSGFVDEHDFNYSMIFGTLYVDESQLRKWYKRVLQVPMIEFDGKYAFFCPASQRKRVEGYSQVYVYMERAQWIETFYGEGDY